MPRFLIDVNLPRYFSLWNTPDYVFVYDINDRLPDMDIWDYAGANNLVIVSKDGDFSDLAMLSSPPPRVVHVRLGNMKMRDFHNVLSRAWPWVCANIEKCRLVRIFSDRIEHVADDGSTQP